MPPLKVCFLGSGAVGDKCHKYLSEHPSIVLDDENPDVLLSVLYPKRVREPLLSLPSLGCINFHAAPLPNYRGVASCTFAILNKETRWGVTAHYMEPEFDIGDIIHSLSVPIYPDSDTAESLSKRTHDYLYVLFLLIITDLLKGNPLPRRKQHTGAYYSWLDFDRVKRSIYNPSKEIA